MHEILIRYLDKNKNFHLPGIGAFELVTEAANLDFINQTIYPPKAHIVFHAEKEALIVTESSSITNEKTASSTDNKDQLRHFLSKHLNMPESIAIHEFEQYAAFVKLTLEKNGFYELPGIGVLQQNEKSTHLANAYSSEKYFEPLHITQVIRENATHSVRVGEEEKTSDQMKEYLHREVKKERWWIAAVILSVIGIGAIVYYYFALA